MTEPLVLRPLRPRLVLFPRTRRFVTTVRIEGRQDSITVVDESGRSTVWRRHTYGHLGRNETITAVRRTLYLRRPTGTGTGGASYYSAFLDQHEQARVVLPERWWPEDDVRQFADKLALTRLAEIRDYQDGLPKAAPDCLFLRPGGTPWRAR